MTINYTYKDSGRQLMILDLRAPVSLSGIPGCCSISKNFLKGRDFLVDVQGTKLEVKELGDISVIQGSKKASFPLRTI